MIESKSMFAKRIKKPIWWVSKYCSRGIIPTDSRGFVIVEEALKKINNRKRGRPKKAKSQKFVRFQVFVQPRHKKMLEHLVRELRKD